MVSKTHEFCDPVHNFIYVDSDERRVIDSRPVQRLRHIHQLAMSYMVYPGATHRRFEHSLGTMHLAGQAFDVLTASQNLHGETRQAFPQITDEQERRNWRRVVRLAALCHDIGHLPFSHAAEHELLPEGWSHETLTYNLILSDEISSKLDKINIEPEQVAKIAVGPKAAKEGLTPLEALMSDIIVSDAFGVDRMDYLLRDSLHTGVAHGKFDHHRLIDTMRILPRASEDDTSGGGHRELVLGIKEGGLPSVEALIMARYHMFSQVYFHRVRVQFDILLSNFLKDCKDWLPSDKHSIDLDSLLECTDSEVMVAIFKVARALNAPGHKWAKRLANREVIETLQVRKIVVSEGSEELYNKEDDKIGDRGKVVRRMNKGGQFDFSIMQKDSKIVSSKILSDIINKLPAVVYEYIFEPF